MLSFKPIQNIGWNNMKSIRLHKLLVEKYILQQKILEHKTLLEAQDYEGMFKGILDQVQSDGEWANHPDNVELKRRTESLIKTYIEWAKTTLKKNDRIVWFLRWVRYWLNTDLLKLPKQEALKDLNKRANTNYTENDFIGMRSIVRDLEHFMSLNNPKINACQLSESIPPKIV